MKYLLIIALVVTLSNNALSQISGDYKLSNSNDKLECLLHLFRTGEYYMEIYEQESPDMVFSHILSAGRYKMVGEKIVMNDAIHAFTMEMTLKENKITAQKSFTFAMSNTFYYVSENYETNSYISPTTPQIQKTAISEYKKANNKPYVFSPGTYSGCRGLHLVVQNENDYVLYIKGLIYSIGTWERADNILRLFDTTLKHHFYVFIGAEYLAGSFLPGDFDRCRLEKVK
jgi:hypothetical protein